MKVGFSFQRRKMLLFLTLTHNGHDSRDVTCKPAIIVTRRYWNVQFGVVVVELIVKEEE